MVRYRSRNSNWKGGISLVKNADDILNLSVEAADMLTNRLLYGSDYSDNGCLIWRGPFFRNIQARLTLGKNNLLASRVMYVLTRWESIGDKCVCHTCDNPKCLNPEHLWLGSNADNSKDMTNKKRQAYGEKNGGAKLTKEQVDTIRAFIDEFGLRGNRAALAKAYGVCRETISCIASGRSWNVD